MITFGIDVIALAVIGLLALCATFWWCKLTLVTQESGEGACFGSAFTVVFMLVGYVIMARVLDWIVAM